MREILDFISCIFSARDIVEVRQLMNGSSEQSWHFACDLPGEAQNFNDQNLRGFNIYCGVNPRPDFGVCKDANIKICRNLFCDFDKKHFPPDCTDQTQYALDKATFAGLPRPTMIIDSGHGRHLYWRFAEPIEPSRWSRGMRLLSEALGSDTTIGNAERIMRLPGLMNCKPPIAPCRILEHDSARIYDLADFAALRETQTPEPCVQPPKQIRRIGGDEENRARAYAAKWENLLEGDGRNQALYRHVKQLHNDRGMSLDIVRQIVQEWNSGNNPPLCEKEFSSAFSSALKYSSKKVFGYGNVEKVFVPKPTTDSPSSIVKQRLNDSISGARYSVDWRWPQIDDLTSALLPATQTLICGEPGSSKSFMALQTAAYWHENGVQVSILETEETLGYHLERLLAQRTGLKGLIKPSWCKEHPDETLQAWESNRDFLDSFGTRVTDNCRKFITMGGSIEWCREQAVSGSRIIIIDPVTALDRGRGEIFDLDKNYIHNIQALIDEFQCSVIMVTHPTKEYERPSLAKISGGAAFEQFTQTVLWLYAIPKDEAKVSYIRDWGGLHAEVSHDREIWILKARNGCGTGLKLAANFEDNLRLKVEGVICAKPKGGNNE